ncbi:MAG TPA: glycosyltransferase family 39 protein [Kofleriaceae bacterium]|nr:glycosyltransferase family 39 protein [Kofleriaceae bacterium]
MPSVDSAPRRRIPITLLEVSLVAVIAAAVLIPGISGYQLIDPWETHYGEVSRRILEEDDWVKLRWQDEVFRSKPALTFWMQAASMKTLGVAKGGGYSGEMTASNLVPFAVRLPSALFGVLGLVLMWLMLVRLVSRRAAYLGLLVVATTPFYFLVARQAITDMPMVACVVGAIACFLMAMEDGDVPVKPFLWRITAVHVILATLVVLIGGQALYYLHYFRLHPGLAHSAVPLRFPGITMAAPMLLGLAALIASAFWPFPLRYRRQVYMLWFFVLMAVSVLSKGIVAPGLVGAVCLFYFITTGHWRKLSQIEILRGLPILLLIAIPWHVAMWLKDGDMFIQRYVIYNNLNRGAAGVFGDRGTFSYYASQIGLGMWPWMALLPAALVAGVRRGLPDSPAGRVRLTAGLWACIAVALFAMVPTKFHHYILPAIPAFGILVALFIDDVLARKTTNLVVLGVIAATIVLFVGHDLVLGQERFVELFIFRHDRPWPSEPPWNIDFSSTLWAFSLVFAAAMIAFSVRRTRWLGLGVLALSAVGLTLWAGNTYMHVAADHWGQRALHRDYYRLRNIYGVDIKYHPIRDRGRCIPDLAHLAADFGGGDYRVESVLPADFAPGLPMTVRLFAPCAGLAKDQIEVHGTVSKVGDDRFWIHLPQAEHEKLSDLIHRGRTLPAARTAPWVQVNADRLLAWQLYWRGENFWSGGEIWGEIPETHTGFKRDAKAIGPYLEKSGIAGRTYYVVTERGRKSQLASALPKGAKDSVKVVDDTSCNKFVLLSFVLAPEP